MIRTIKQTISAGGTLEFNAQASAFRLLESSGPVVVKFFWLGAEWGAADDMEAGFAADGQQFDKVTVYSATTQSVKFAISDAGMKYDRSAGSVSIINVNGAFANVQKTVTSTSALLLVANAARRYLLVQNNDATGVIYVRMDGALDISGTGVKIAPGGSYEVSGYAPTGAISAIGSIASNANIVVVEG